MGLTTRLMTAAAVTLGLSSAVYAADLVVEQPPYVEPVLISNWEGGYIGGFVGFGWASVDLGDEFDDEFCFDEFDDDCGVDLSGWLIGLQGGYNWTLGNGFVLGVAGDIAWADLSGDDDDDEIVEDILDLSNSVEWEGSLRVLAGYDAGAFMPYLTAGVSFAGAHHDVDWWDEEWFSDDQGTTYVGGTFGVGVMYAVSEGIALDMQYRHTWYGGDTIDWDNDDLDFLDSDINLQTDRITVGLNFTF